MILRDLKRSDEVQEKVVCIIDDNPNKWGRDIEGVPVVGGRDDILHYVEKYDIEKIQILVGIASYMFICILLKHDMFYLILNQIKKYLGH